jgi:enoyl-CoA hydratase
MADEFPTRVGGKVRKVDTSGGSVTNPEVTDGVTIVRFDQPPVNALDLDLLEVIIASMRNIEGPVVITGAGRCFSAGVDLRALVDGGAEYAERFVTALSEAFLAIFDHPAPVVAAINGHAIAGGCVLAMCADIRLMSAGTIGLSELSVGVPFPVAALEICRFAMGTSATRAALQAKTIDAKTALARGWIDEVVPNDELISRAAATARELGEYSPSAYAATKRQLHQHARIATDAGVEMDAEVRASWINEETRGRIAAFVEALARNR